MICPVCQTNNKDVDHCSQCSSDLAVHRLLKKVNEEMTIQNEMRQPKSEATKNSVLFLSVFQMLPSVFLLVCATIFLFVSLHILMRLPMQNPRPSPWSQGALAQLLIANQNVSKELDLIIAQRQENNALRMQINDLQQRPQQAQTVFNKKPISINQKSSV